MSYIYVFVLSFIFMLLRAVPIVYMFFFFLMIRRPPRSTLDRSSAASDVYKRQGYVRQKAHPPYEKRHNPENPVWVPAHDRIHTHRPVSYTHLRAHETVLDLVCRLLLEKKKSKQQTIAYKKLHALYTHNTTHTDHTTSVEATNHNTR